MAHHPASPVLDAMQQELGRSMERLSMDENPKPYFISYQIKDRQTVSMVARQGAIYQDALDRSRLLNVDVRVGDYALDNSGDAEGRSFEELTLYQAPSSAPLDTHGAALRHVLWLATDQKYKEALTAYHRVMGKRVYQVEKKSTPSPSFTREEPTVHRDPITPQTVDRDRWLSIGRKLSEILGQAPEIFDSSFSLDVRKTIRYQVTSEGTRLVTEHTIYGVHLRAVTRAADGMLLDSSQDLYGPTEAELPSDAELVSAAKKTIENLLALRKAEVLEPLTVPAILEPRAAGVLFHEAVGHRLEGDRQDKLEEGRTFTDQLGRKVLPDTITVIDDPTQASFEGTPLNGAYGFDDEAIAAQKVVLIEKGRLNQFLMRRKPIEHTHHSNGHARAEGNERPMARMANLFVKTQNTVSRDKLKALLLEEIRKQDKPFGLIIDDIAGGSTNTSSYGYQAFKGMARMVYKVDGDTGEETLVRGVEIVGTPLASVNKIAAATKMAGVFNGYCGAESGYVPVSTIAPAMLFREIEIQRSAKPKQKGQILMPPGHKTP